MDEATFKKIKMIYAELIGLASKLPNSDTQPWIYHARNQVELFNELVVDAGKLVNENFDKFKCKENSSIRALEYNSKVMGLLNIIKKVYLPEEPDPFSGTPTTSVTQITHNQITNQVNVQIATELSSKIGELLATNPSKNEKYFLTKLKEMIPLTNGVLDLISKMATIAATYGITLEGLKRMFG